MAKEKQKKEEKKETAIAGEAQTQCADVKCPFHGGLKIRGRTFKGYVKRLVGDRCRVEWERIIYHPKFERYSKRQSKIHAHIPKCMLAKIKIGNYVKIGECRPLSKIIHFVVLEVIK